MSNYKVVKELATLRTDSRRQLRLSVMKWDGAPEEKYDLRLWHEGLPDEWAPGKGIILSEGEARKLIRALEGEILSRQAEAREPAEPFYAQTETGERVVVRTWRPRNLEIMTVEPLADQPDGDQEAENDAPDAP